MAELESKEAVQLGDHPAYGEAPERPGPDSWGRTLITILSFVIPYTLVREIMEIWSPWHLAIGTGCVVGFLVQSRFIDPLFHHFGKSVIFYLLVSAGVSLLALALKNMLAF